MLERPERPLRDIRKRTVTSRTAEVHALLRFCCERGRCTSEGCKLDTPSSSRIAVKTGLDHMPAVKTRVQEILLHEAFVDALQSQ